MGKAKGGQVKDKELNSFKDGVADALLKGNQATQHKNIHFYKQGYDFGLTMYAEINELDKEKE